MIFLKKHNFFLPILLITALTWSCGCQSVDSEKQNLYKICVKASEEKIGKYRKVEKYCECAVPYLYEYFKDDPEKMQKFADGDFDHINTVYDPDFSSYLDKCVLENIDFNPSSMEKFITPEQEESIRFAVKDEMDENFKATHDTEKFCDCYMEHIKQFSMKEFNNLKIASTPRYKNMMTECATRSLLK